MGHKDSTHKAFRISLPSFMEDGLTFLYRCLTLRAVWQPRVDLNHWMQESKSCALPLGYWAILLILYCSLELCVLYHTISILSRDIFQNIAPTLPILQVGHPLCQPLYWHLRRRRLDMAILIDRTFTTMQCLSIQQPPLISGDTIVLQPWSAHLHKRHFIYRLPVAVISVVGFKCFCFQFSPIWRSVNTQPLSVSTRTLQHRTCFIDWQGSKDSNLNRQFWRLQSYR